MAKGLSQTEHAKRAGVGESTAHRIETDADYTPKWESVVRLAEAVDHMVVLVPRERRPVRGHRTRS